MSKSRSGTPIEGTPFQISLEETYVCASQIIEPKFFTFTLIENIDLSVSTEGAESKSLYSVLMDWSLQVLKPLNVTNKKVYIGGELRNKRK